MSGGLLFLLFVILAIVLVVCSCYAAARRRQELAAWAQSRGLRFSPEREYGLDQRYPGFDAFRKGENRYACNTMRGNWNGRALLGLDYHYETHSTDSKGRRQTHHHSFSAVLLDSAVPLKPLFIRPEGFFDKVTEFLGFDDIDFESAEFSRKFYVKASDRKWAYDVIHPRTMEFLLSRPAFTIQFDARVAMISGNGTFRAVAFAQAAEVLEGVLDRMPDYLVKQQQGAES